MGRSVAILTAVACVLLFAPPSRSDATAPPPPPALPASTAPPEAITGKPATSAPGAERPGRNPFKPYATGPGKHWAYKDLPAGERAVVDKGRNVTGWNKVHAGFAAAATQLAHRAAADAAAHRLGVASLAGIGVVR